MQAIIKAYPETIFVLLHGSYPYTREAGYLTATYSNVYLDFGEVSIAARKESIARCLTLPRGFIGLPDGQSQRPRKPPPTGL
jgi:predicted TIM-barrel fold metal-dependent hydrolase